jgi:hypothetical protein
MIMLHIGTVRGNGEHLHICKNYGTKLGPQHYILQYCHGDSTVVAVFHSWLTSVSIFHLNLGSSCLGNDPILLPQHLFVGIISDFSIINFLVELPPSWIIRKECRYLGCRTVNINLCPREDSEKCARFVL